MVEVYDHLELPSDIHIARRRSQQSQGRGSVASTAFGAQTSLHMETTENICALLRTFLQYLPEPILPPCLFEAIWNWCGIRQEAARITFHDLHTVMPTNRSGSVISSEELMHIYGAQMLLHLLPTPNFSLLVYLLSFFSQVVMVPEVNGLTIEDVGSMFGTIVFGGRTGGKSEAKLLARGDIMMRWFLRRWRQIYSGLFPYDDDGHPSKSGVNHVLSPAGPGCDNSVGMTRPMSGYFGLRDPLSISLHDELSPVREEPEAELVGSPGSGRSPGSGELNSFFGCTYLLIVYPVLPPSIGSDISAYQQSVQSSEEPTIKYLEEVWPHLTPELRIKLNERMLDVMLEPLLSSSDPKMTRRRSNSVPSRLESSVTFKPPAAQRQLDLAKQRVVHLERIVNETQRLLQETLNESDRVKQGSAMLEVRVKALEVELKVREARYKENEENMRRRLEGKVEDVAKQRDQARSVVSEIQRISGSVREGRGSGGGWSRT